VIGRASPGADDQQRARELQRNSQGRARTDRRDTDCPSSAVGVCHLARPLSDPEDAQGDALKLIAVFTEQPENLFKDHDFILDLVAARLRGKEWEEIQAPPDILNELEIMNKRLGGASSILLLDSSGQARATALHLGADEPVPPDNKACFLAL
jgi:hypothetical protein